MAQVIGGTALDDQVEKLLAARALLALNQQHREVIIEIYYHRRSAIEAAAILGIPETTVRSLAYDALRALRSVLRRTDATAHVETP